MKRVLTITAISIACLGGLYTYLTWNSNGNPRFMHHRYNKVVTEPLAKIGFSDAQYKMGLFYLDGAINPPSEEYDTKTDIEKAISWWEKASERGNQKARKELVKAKERLRIDSLATKGMHQYVIVHLNTDKSYDAIIQTLYDADRNKYYFITSIKRNGRWEEIDSQLRDLEKEYSPDRKPHIQDFIRSLQERATHVADIDGELYLINI